MASNNSCNGDDVNPPAYCRLHESARMTSKTRKAIEISLLVPVLAIVMPPLIVIEVARIVVGE